MRALFNDESLNEQLQNCEIEILIIYFDDVENTVKTLDLTSNFLGHSFKKKKNNFVASFYGWGSTASRLEPLRGGSLLFTTKFPEILVLILSTSEG